MKIILIVVGVFSILYFIWKQLEHNLGQKDDFKKSKHKMVGLSTIQELNELDFLAKYFKGKFNHKDWQERIEKKILKEKFDDLTKRYNIIVEQK